MLRAVLALACALGLSGCWVSEKRLFGPEDFVAPPGLEGSFVSENGEGAVEATVLLSIEPNRLIRGVATKIAEDEPAQVSLIGLVPIAGGSGRYFLMLDRSDDTREGDIYLVGHLTDDEGLEAFWPQCPGTPDISGMTREKVELIGEEACGFASRAAVMQAAPAAEKILTARQMFEFKPIGRLKKSDESDPSDGEPGGTQGEDFTRGDAFFDE